MTFVVFHITFISNSYIDFVGLIPDCSAAASGHRQAMGEEKELAEAEARKTREAQAEAEARKKREAEEKERAEARQKSETVDGRQTADEGGVLGGGAGEYQENSVHFTSGYENIMLAH
jgi:hypothetical protein